MRLRDAPLRFAALTLLLAAGCGGEGPGPAAVRSGKAFALTSPAFRPGEAIPKRHAHPSEGDDVSPPLQWTSPPPRAKGLALVVDDPDAPQAEPWVHWTVYCIPIRSRALPEGVAKGVVEVAGASGARQGKNDFDEDGWGGPLPPVGSGTHHYRFRLFALDRTLDLEAGASRSALEAAMRGHVLDTAELVGTYERR